MAYQLEYTFCELKKSPIAKKKKRNVIVISFLLAAIVICSHLGTGVLEILLSGQDRNISSAASEMVAHLREGMAFGDAVYVFCEEITAENSPN